MLSVVVSTQVVGSQVWRPMQVGDSSALDFEETGIVATASHVLAQASVTIYYFTTYCTVRWARRRGLRGVCVCVVDTACD